MKEYLINLRYGTKIEHEGREHTFQSIGEYCILSNHLILPLMEKVEYKFGRWSTITPLENII